MAIHQEEIKIPFNKDTETGELFRCVRNIPASALATKNEGYPISILQTVYAEKQDDGSYQLVFKSIHP